MLSHQMLEPKVGDQADLELLGFGMHSVSEPCSPSQPTCSPLSGLSRARTSIPSECLSYPSECVQPPPTLGDTSKTAHMEPAAIWKERVKEPKRGEREPEFEKREQGEGESARPTSSSSSSSPLIIPKLCLDRSFNPDALTSPSTDDDDDEDLEEEDEEEDSDEGYLKRRSLVEMSPGRGQQSTRLCVQRSLHRRTHSEGSLLQEPRSPRFISDQAIHCMENSREMEQRWTVPSPQTLRKELMKNRGSVHQICLLFTGRRVCFSFIDTNSFLNYISLSVTNYCITQPQLVSTITELNLQTTVCSTALKYKNYSVLYMNFRFYGLYR